MRRVLLINPATPLFPMRLFPPLALAVQAGSIPEHYEVKIIDENISPLTYEGDLAAISANTYSIRRAYELAQVFRQKKIPVILGGNHPSILPEEAAGFADAVVIGDGETVWPEILKDLEGKRLQKYYQAAPYAFDRQLLPRRDLLSPGYRFASLETVRGCPYDCDFCSVTRYHGASYRFKPLELIEAELRQLRRKTLFLVDDNFIGAGKGAAERAEALFDLFRRYGIRWMGQASINIADNPALLRAARQSGCLFLFIGFESLNPAALQSLNKKLNYRRGVSFYREVISRIHEQGISIMGSFIIGSDYDTRESIRELRQFIRESEIDIPNITHLTPYPGTRIYEALHKAGRLFQEQFWLQDPFPLFTFEPEQISLAALKEATLELLADEEGLLARAKGFINTLKHTRSLRSASYALAESTLNARLMRKRLERVPAAYASYGPPA